MRKYAPKLLTVIALVLAAALFLPQRAAADDDDPPSRVARLSYTHGPVSFQPAGTDDWVSAVVNRPLTTGDKLWVDNGARAELHLGSASIRLASTTGFSFLNLADNSVQLRLTEGTLRIRVKRLGENESFEIDTPNLAFSVLRPGTYKVSVNEEGDTTVVTVRSGEGEATGGGQAFTVHPDEVGTFSGTDQLNGDIESYGGDEDDFDQWSSNRDRREDHSESARYVSNDAIGYQDLDDNGSWRPVPEYGRVWFPHTTVADWAPYRYGHWVWVSPWGWTWVDDEPWGFAPFHYGRWVVVGGVWGWVPCAPAPVVVGVAYVRPVYAPALVAWVGGEHFGVGVGVGAGVAWFPLGPREVYMPSYPVSRTYVNNVNVTNTTVNTTVVNNYYNNTVVNKNVTVNNTNVTNIKYVNQSVPGAVTATSHAAFTSAQPVGKNMVKVDAREVARAPVNATTPTIAPQQKSALGAGAAVAVKPPASFQNRAVVAKATPPPAPPRFEKQQEAIKANGGKPLAISQVRQIQPERTEAAAHVKIAPPAKAATPQNVHANKSGQPPANAGNRSGTPSSSARPPVQPATKADTRPGTPPSSARPPVEPSANAGTRPGTPPSSARPTVQPPANARNRPGTPPSNARPPVQPPTNAGNKPDAAPNNARPTVQPLTNARNRPDTAPSNIRSPVQPAANASNKPDTPPSNARPPVQTNKPGTPATSGSNQKASNDRPPSARPSSSANNVNPQLDQKQQQERQKEHKQPPPPPKPTKEDKPPQK